MSRYEEKARRKLYRIYVEGEGWLTRTPRAHGRYPAQFTDDPLAARTQDADGVKGIIRKHFPADKYPVIRVERAPDGRVVQHDQEA